MFPPDLHGIVAAGLQRVVDFQDVAYGGEYLDRLEALRSSDPGLMQAFAKYLAVAMAYDDVIRVADRKTRARRFERVRRETGAGAAQIVAITEFFHPRIEEIAGLLPPWLGEKVERNATIARLVDRGRRLRTTAPLAFLALFVVGGLRRFRRGTLRHAREMRHLQAWAQRVQKFAGNDVALATALSEARRLVNGYSDTHARGDSKFDRVMQASDRHPGPTPPPQSGRRLTPLAIQ